MGRVATEVAVSAAVAGDRRTISYVRHNGTVFGALAGKAWWYFIHTTFPRLCLNLGTRDIVADASSAMLCTTLDRCLGVIYIYTGRLQMIRIFAYDLS